MILRHLHIYGEITLSDSMKCQKEKCVRRLHLFSLDEAFLLL